MNGATLLAALLILGSLLALVRAGALSGRRPVGPLKEVGEPKSAVRVLREQEDLDKALARAMRKRGPRCRAEQE